MKKNNLFIKRSLSCLFAFLMTVMGAKADDMTSTPLTLEATNSGEITFTLKLGYGVDASVVDAIEYKKNDGAWTTYTWNDAISVVNGDKVAFRGNNVKYYGNGSPNFECHIISSADVCVYGNMMSLIHASDFATNYTMTDDWNFAKLFRKSGENPWDPPVTVTTIKSHSTNDIVLGLWALVAKYGLSETNSAKRVIRDGAVSFVGEYGGTNDLLSLRAILTNRADFAQDSAIGASISILRHSPELIPLARGIMTNSVVFSIRQRRWTHSLLLGMCTEGESDMYIADSAQHARIAMLFLEYAALDSEEPLGADYLACRLNPSYRHSQQRRDNLARLRPPGLTGRRAELYDAAQRDAAQEG